MINNKWKFVLNSVSLGEVELDDDPSGWDVQKVSIARSAKYFGLFRSFSTSLRFFGDGFDYVQTVFERNGTEHEIRIAIYEYVAKPTDRYELFFQGVIDLSTYINDESKFIEVDINESSFTRKIISRDDIKIKIDETISIDGLTLTTNQDVTVNLHQREILSLGVYELNEPAAIVQSTLVIKDLIGWEGFTLPIQIKDKDSLVDNLSGQDDAVLFVPAGVFWDPAGTVSIGTFTGTVSGILRNAFAQSGSPTNVTFLLRVYIDDTAQVIDFDTPITGANFVVPTDGSDVPFTFTIDIQIGSPPSTFIQEGATISLISLNPDASSTGYKGYECEFTSIDFNVSQNLQWKDGTPAQGYLMHEVGERLTQVMTDQETPFVSTLLGRPDIGYESLGERALLSFHSGSQIRQFATQPFISFSDWFSSMDAMFNVGAGIEFDATGQPFLRFEKKEHFFSGNVIATLHSVSKLTKSVAREWIYNSVKVGADKVATEEDNGREEYNNKFEWASFIKTIKNLLDLISKIRFDGYGIEKMRRLGVDTNPTEDSKEDNDNWVIVVKEDGANYKSVKNEDYEILEGVFSPDTVYNVDLSPGRNLRNSGDLVRAGLEKYLDEPLRFKNAEQLDSMVSKRFDETLTITENADIDVSTLKAPLWIPELYSFEFVLTRELFQAISKSPNGIIKFSTGTENDTTNYNYGWITKIENNANNGKAVAELLRVNLANPDLVLVDPDGNSPDIPQLPITPPVTFGFGSGFPFVFVGPDS